MICYWLKKYGFSPTLIEKSKELRTGGYAVDVRGIAADIVKKMGIYDAIYTKRTSVLSKRYVDAEGRILSEEKGEKASFREGSDVEIERGNLVDILFQSISDIPCHFDKEIMHLIQKDEFVEVTFKGGQTEHYDLVIAADGLHSSTRKMAFSRDEYDLFSLGSYIGIFSIPNYLHLNRVEVSFVKDQKIIGVNCDQDPDRALVRLAFCAKKALSGIESEKRQKRCLKETFYGLGWESNRLLDLIDDSKDFYFDAIAQIKMDCWTKGRVALVGDAGYCPSPMSGQGTNLAIVGAYILAGELKLAKGDFSIAFKRYNELMRPLVDASQDLGVWVGESYLPEGEISKERVEERSNLIREKIKVLSSGISLPNYE
ncbi:MAG: FAD-dependent monooxygenase [Simkaniaceae bacterium]|nr:FAD-dependent monooxygenase [Simkaniaceae bacterium]